MLPSALRLQTKSLPTLSSLFAKVLLAAACLCSRSAAQTLFTAASTSVGSTSSTQTATLTIKAAGTATTINVLTLGSPNLDFQLTTGGTCAPASAYTVGQTCTVNFTFSPKFPGNRAGGITLTGTGGTVLASIYLAGTGNGPLASILPGTAQVIAGVGTTGNNGSFSGDNGSALNATFNQIFGMAIDGAGNTYLADTYNCVIRKITKATGIITTVVGNHATACSTYDFNGDGLTGPNTIIADPNGLALDGLGNLYFADRENHRIRVLSASTGLVTTIGGMGNGAPYTDNIPALTAYMYPQNIAVDSAGNVFYSDTSSNRIRKISAATGIVTTVAGNGINSSGPDNVVATQSAIYQIVGIALDPQGNLYIADQFSDLVRRVDATTGIITPVAGTFLSQGPSGDGAAATSAQLGQPFTLAFDGAGNLYIGSACCQGDVRKVNLSTGIITTVGGSNYGQPPTTPTPANLAYTGSHGAMAIDGAGNIFLADVYQQRVTQISAIGAAETFPSTPVNTTSNTTLPFTLTNIGNTALHMQVPTAGLNPSILGPYAFKNTSTCPLLSPSGTTATLAGGASCSDILSFAPTAVSPTNAGSFTFTDDSANLTGATQTISLSGISTGTATSSSLTLNPSSGIVAGQSVTLNATVSPANATGSFMFYDNATALSTALALTNASASYTVLNITPGSHSYTAVFSGTGGFGGSTSTAQPVVLPVTVTPTITWPTPSAITYGTTLTAVLNASASYNGTAVAGTFAYTATPGSTVTAASALVAGTYTLSVLFTPTNTGAYTTATSSVPLIVTKGTATATLTTSTNAIFSTNPVTFTATIASAASTPTGTVTFFDNGTAIGSPVALTNGVATLTSTTLTTAAHTITATYSGDSNFNTVNLTSVAVTVSDVSIFTNIPAIIVARGGTSSTSIYVQPVGSTTFPQAISFSVSGLSGGVTGIVTPSTLAAGTAAGYVILTVSVPSNLAMLEHHPAGIRSTGRLGGLAAVLLLLPFASRWRKSGLRAGTCIVSLLLAVSALCLTTACGSSAPLEGQVATFTVTSGSNTHQAPVNIYIH